MNRREEASDRLESAKGQAESLNRQIEPLLGAFGSADELHRALEQRSSNVPARYAALQALLALRL